MLTSTFVRGLLYQWLFCSLLRCAPSILIVLTYCIRSLLSFASSYIRCHLPIAILPEMARRVHQVPAHPGLLAFLLFIATTTLTAALAHAPARSSDASIMTCATPELCSVAGGPRHLVRRADRPFGGPIDDLAAHPSRGPFDVPHAADLYGPYHVPVWSRQDSVLDTDMVEHQLRAQPDALRHAIHTHHGTGRTVRSQWTPGAGFRQWEVRTPGRRENMRPAQQRLSDVYWRNRERLGGRRRIHDNSREVPILMRVSNREPRRGATRGDPASRESSQSGGNKENGGDTNNIRPGSGSG